LVDRLSLLRAAVDTLAVQSIGISVAAGCLFLAISRENSLWGIASILFSVFARLGSLGSTIAVEKRWTIVLAQGASEYTYGRLDSLEAAPSDEQEICAGPQLTNRALSRINARLRSIDLTCNLCAPIVVGLLLDYTAPKYAALVIGSFNLLAWPLEVLCLRWIHGTYRDVFNSPAICEVDQNEVKGEKVEARQDWMCEPCLLYWKQPCFRSFLALALLYLSIVGFGSIMTAWLGASGFRPGFVGIARAFAAISGLGATFVTPNLVQRFGAELAGVGFIWWMWAFILPCTIAAFFSSQCPLCLWIVVGCVIFSRFGLWGFDLTVTQLLQERIVPSEKVGAVNGTHAALQNAFDALAALACVVLPGPEDFVWLICFSLASVTIAASLHTSRLSTFAQK
jgi:iron-regulated transporter 1